MFGSSVRLSVIPSTLQLVGWLVVLRINVALAAFQPYRDLEAGDNQSLEFKWRGGESNPGPLAPIAKSLTTRPPLLPRPAYKQSAIFKVWVVIQ